MELRVEPVTFPEAIRFNYEELKAEITSKVEMYKNLVYTGSDQIKDAKADRAALNKLIKAMSDERIRIKKDCLKPYDEFERKIRELTDIVNEPVQLIDKQIKEYEQTLKEEKRKDIEALFETIGFQAFVKLDMIWDEKWLNASVSMKSIEEKMRERMYQISTDLLTLNRLSEYAFEAVAVYKETLDMNRSIAEAQRMSDIAKQKAETEARKKAEEERRAKEAEEKKVYEKTAIISESVPEQQQPEHTVTEPEEPEKMEVRFAALLTTEDALALKEFFQSRNIEFRAI
jgi:hypothetical protein|nr:MAG TPA: Protein of unknown function (DUF1351) [Caudoviricetes sp.]